VRYGANNGGATTDGEWWRLITSMFMHYGVLHLALNMWALFQTGHLVEKLLGRLSYLLAYFGSGITGGLASIIWHGDKIWSAGASGAIFGVYGALFGYMLREKHTLPRSVFQPLFKSTIVFAGYNLLYGLSHPGIDNAAHIGGILGGFAIGWAVAVPIDPPLRAKLMAGRFRLGVAVAAVLIGGGVALAPRFDYRLVDELAWAGANKGQVEKEKDLLKSFGETLDRYRSTGSGDALTGLLRDELIPFYEHWRTQVAGLRLEPDRLTARRRTKLSKIFDLRIGNYQDLLVGMRKRDPMAMDRFLQEEKRTSEAIAKLSDGQ
jgi:rhomboid protease GluP